MTTELNKDISRETSVKVDGKNLIVTLTKDNKIQIKQKGKGKDVKEIEISIEQLFQQLVEGNVLDETKPLISLYDFRSQYIINPKIDIKTKTILEQITIALIKKV